MRQLPSRQSHLYVIDHLVPLEVGGSNDIRNLWPEPKTEAEQKDETENLLHTRVCNATIDLAAAQQVFETTWSPRSAPPAQTPPLVAPTATVATLQPTNPAPTPGDGATAICRDGTYSYAANHSGACSHHGGVAQFYK